MPGMCTYVDGRHAKEVLAESRRVSTTPFGLPSAIGCGGTRDWRREPPWLLVSTLSSPSLPAEARI